MNPVDREFIVKASILGALRGSFVHCAVHPIDVIRTHQQIRGGRSDLVIQQMIQEKASFYRGFFPQLIKTAVKQAWCWPLIMEIPSFLSKWNLGSLTEQALTALSIATVEALVTSPLEKRKIQLIYQGKTNISLQRMVREGWSGAHVHWMKLAVNWSVFLVTQKFLRDRARTEGELSLLRLSEIGVKVALITTLASVPFDHFNTLKQVDKLQIHSLKQLYRGLPLSFVSSVVHSVASMILIELLRASKDKSL